MSALLLLQIETPNKTLFTADDQQATFGAGLPSDGLTVGYH
jgi:hypothetical protein